MDTYDVSFDRRIRIAAIRRSRLRAWRRLRGETTPPEPRVKALYLALWEQASNKPNKGLEGRRLLSYHSCDLILLNRRLRPESGGVRRRNRNERDVDVCWYGGHTGYGRGYLRHRHSFLADGAPLRRPYRETPGAFARVRSFPAQDSATARPRPGGEPAAGGGATRECPGDGGVRDRTPAGRRVPRQPATRRPAPAGSARKAQAFCEGRRAEGKDGRSGTAARKRCAAPWGAGTAPGRRRARTRLEQVPRQVLPEVLRQVPGALRRLRAPRRASPRDARRGRQRRARQAGLGGQ